VIASLRGQLVARRRTSDLAHELVVDVGGVGYLVSATSATATACGAVGAEVTLSIYTHVREGEMTLYGFAAPDERAAFVELLAAHGVGPALGLAILAILPPAALAAVVLDEDIDALTKVPGVGRKTAARLLIELRGRFARSSAGDGLGSLPAVGTDGATLSTEGTAHGEVAEALRSLGYGPDEVRAALAGLPGDGTSSTLLRQALVQLAGAR
jgi:Holliday junction DNA helicase RuvA